MKITTSICLSLCLLLSAFFSGCSRTTLNVFNTEQQAILIFEQTSDPTTQAALQTFSNRVYELSDPPIRITVTGSDDSLNMFHINGAQFYFGPQDQVDSFSLAFDAINTPFSYQNYLQFTMTTHSPDALSVLRSSSLQKSNVFPLGSIYQGSWNLLSTQPISTSTEWLNYYENATNPSATVASLRSFPFFGSMGLQVEEVSSQTERLQLLSNTNTQITEVFSTQLSDVNLPEESLYYVQDFHFVSTWWMMTENSFYQSLNPRQQAAIQQAFAELSYTLEAHTLQQEQESINYLQQNNVTISGYSADFRNLVLRNSVWVINSEESEELYDYFDSIIQSVQV